MVINNFDESKVRRATDGKFANKTHAEADNVVLASATAEQPRTVLEVNHYVGDGRGWEEPIFYDTEYVDVTDVLHGMTPENRQFHLSDEVGGEHLVELARARGLVKHNVGPYSVMNLESVAEDMGEYWDEAPVQAVPQSGSTPRVDHELGMLSDLTVQEKEELVRRLQEELSTAQGQS